MSVSFVVFVVVVVVVVVVVDAVSPTHKQKLQRRLESVLTRGRPESLNKIHSRHLTQTLKAHLNARAPMDARDGVSHLVCSLDLFYVFDS